MPSLTTLLDEFRPIGGDLNTLPDTPERRLAPANFAPGTTDGLIEGPNPRTLSNVVSGGPLADQTDPTVSGWLYVMGQFIDHDLDLQRLTTTDISITSADGVIAMSRVAVATVQVMGATANTSSATAAGEVAATAAIGATATATAINTITANLDLSQVYGSDAATAASLREADGTMRTWQGGPPLVDGLFVAGDARVMENPELTAVTALFLREHNHWAALLHHQHPRWTGDQVYEMARAITTAEYQQIVYGQFLHALVGDAVRPYAGYDAAVNPQVSVEFAGAAFRVGHSQVSDEQAGIDNAGNETFSQTLAESFQNTPDTTLAHGLDALLRHLSADFSQVTDVYAIGGLRDVGLIAIDVQRERDLGLNTLNGTREALGLTPYASFEALTDDVVVAANLRAQFLDVANVDLFLGGLAERHASGAQVGETFQKIIADQFTALRDGDRFYWENQALDPVTAQIIADTTLGDLLTRNTDTPFLQSNVFLGAQRHLSGVPAEDPERAQLVIGDDGDVPPERDAVVIGGQADDTLVSGTRLHQLLTGGGGNDTFVVRASAEITDWQSGDKLDLSGLLRGARIHVYDVGGDAVVRYGNVTVQLDGVAAASVTYDDFVNMPHKVLLLSRDIG